MWRVRGGSATRKRKKIGFNRVTQKFPVTNRLSLEKEITFAAVKAAEQEVRDVERLLIAEARSEFVNLLSIRERTQLLDQQRKLSEELAEFLGVAAERGEISSLDAGQARLTTLTLTTQERRLRVQESETLGRLRPLVGIAAEAPVTLAGSVPPLTMPTSSGVDRPDLEAARIDLLAASAGIELERARRRDDVEASIFAAAERTEDAPAGLENEGIIGFKISVPLPFWNDNQGNIDAATAIRDRKTKEIEALQREIHHQRTTALAEMQQWRALISDLDENLLPFAEEQTGLLEKAYLQGHSELQAVLSSREQTLELLASRLDAIREFQLARIRYQTALGQP